MKRDLSTSLPFPSVVVFSKLKNQALGGTGGNGTYLFLQSLIYTENQNLQTLIPPHQVSIPINLKRAIISFKSSRKAP